MREPRYAGADNHRKHQRAAPEQPERNRALREALRGFPLNGCTAGLRGSGHAAILGSGFSIGISRRPTQDCCQEDKASRDIADASYTYQHSSVRLRRFRTHRLDSDRYLDGTGMLEGKRQWKSIAYFQRLCQVAQHGVISTRLELELVAGLNFHRRHRAHLHHAVVERHIVQFDRARDRRRHAEKPVRNDSGIFDGEKHSTRMSAGRRGAGKRVFDSQGFETVVLRVGRGRDKCESPLYDRHEQRKR